MSDSKLVYSTDPKESVNQKPKVKGSQQVVEKNHCIKMRRETKSRGGKTVTVLYELPENKDYVKKLVKELKAKCACGGSLKEKPYTIEIQGEHRDKIKALLEKKGFQVKG